MVFSVEEYRLIKEEIISTENNRYQAISILYVGVAAILTFAISQEEKNALLFIVPFFVIIPIYFMVENLGHGIYKMGAYLYVFHEGESSEFHWETMLYKMNDDTKKTINRRANNFKWPFLALSAASLLLFFLFFDWANLRTPFSVVSILLALICAVVMLAIYSKNADVDALKETYISEWQKLHDANQSKLNLAPTISSSRE